MRDLQQLMGTCLGSISAPQWRCGTPRVAPKSAGLLR
jgi:hypothetical protein